MTNSQTVEVPIQGMDCAECTSHVRRAIADLPGVEGVDVFLASEKALVQLDPGQVDMDSIRQAVEGVGYSVPIPMADPSSEGQIGDHARRVVALFGIVFGAVLFVTVIGEWLGLFGVLTRGIPWPVWLAVILVGGYPVFRKVVRATLRGQVISHTLMTLGVLAAIAVGEWATAAVVVFFMRVGDYAESFTTERARRAVKDLVAMAPLTARVERDGAENEVPVAEVGVGETVVVRPGEKIPVDGQVTGGHATVDQAAITGESMPVEVGPGAHVYAATLAYQGGLRVRVTHVGPDTAFGRVVKMVEEAEAHRGEVQRIADKFSAYYLPVVAAIAALTLLIRRDPMAMAAVLVVACSCAFALATPIAMLASIGAGAKRGLLIKGGKYLESLDRADVLLIDKTGTVTLGRPQITDILPLNGASEEEVLSLAASAERYSEHPLAEAVRAAARTRHASLAEPEEFEAVPGLGVRARVNGALITVGNRRAIPAAASPAIAPELEAQGKTALFVARDGELIGALATADTPRPDVPDALNAVREMGVRHIELLTGDNQLTAAALVEGMFGHTSLPFRPTCCPKTRSPSSRNTRPRVIPWLWSVTG
jgi:Cu+-exporting ATPase